MSISGPQHVIIELKEFLTDGMAPYTFVVGVHGHPVFFVGLTLMRPGRKALWAEHVRRRTADGSDEGQYGKVD